MTQPPALQPGDSIAIIATSRKVSSEDIRDAIKIFSSWGFEVRLGPHVHSNSHTYLAGTDEERLGDLQAVLEDPKIKAIICARGGYGITRILDKIDVSSIHANPKWIVGFSDITALHLKLFKYGISSIHGTMPILFSREESKNSVESLKNVLLSGSFSISGKNCKVYNKANVAGPLIGGNLSLIVDSLGTDSEIETDNAILMVEEIDEYFYRVDRMIMQLRRAGKLAKLKALVVGHMTDIKESTLAFGESVESIVLNAVGEYNYPVIFNFPFGHENPNLAWIHGASASLSFSGEDVLLSADKESV